MKTKAFILMIFVLTLTVSSFAQKAGQKYYITGQVLDVNNKPLSGIMLLIDNKSTNVTTDDKGMYKIKVKADAVTISIFNLSSGVMNEEINGRTVINFKLNSLISHQEMEKQENPENEVVNIGYGIAQKKDLSSNIGTINGQRNKYAIYQNVYEMIKGEVPGVDVDVVYKKIRIRGIATLNGSSDPLVLVNGVSVSLETIDPRMVKSISVLKGSDASIYGSEGANGVILITLIGR